MSNKKYSPTKSSYLKQLVLEEEIGMTSQEGLEQHFFTIGKNMNDVQHFRILETKPITSTWVW